MNILIIKLFVLLVISFPSFIFCQVYERLNVEKLYTNQNIDSCYSWNPLKVGNKWQFIDLEGKRFTKEVLSDTIIDGQEYHYVHFDKPFFSNFERNENSITYLYDIEDLDNDTSSTELLLENFDTPVDSSFYSYRYRNTSHSNRIKIIDRFWAYVYLYDDTVMAITYEVWEWDDWLSTTDIWLQKYGLLDMAAEGNHYFLTGSIIDSVQCGEIVSIMEAKKEKVPIKIKLLGNHPNPFNNSTRISIQLPIASDIKVSIYDIQGRMVKTLFSGNKSSGNYTFTWNGKSDNDHTIASGLFIVQCQTNEKIYSRKIMLLK